MSTTPHPDDGDPTVPMPARAAGAPPAPAAGRLPAPARPGRKRIPSLSVVAAIVLFAIAAAGSFYVVQRMKPLTAPSQRVPEAAAPQVTPQAGLPAPPPSAPAPDKPSSPRQMLKDIFEGRDRGRSVTASVDGGAVRIGSSRPGYVYVLAARAGSSDEAALFLAKLFPRAADTNNRIRPGQPLTLPDLQWPTNAEFLAIVSDEPRDIDVLGSLAGNVICPATARCSESYGAVVFSTEGMRGAVRSPAAPKTPAARPPQTGSRRCSDILERASLGESLTDEEQTFLTRDCR